MSVKRDPAMTQSTLSDSVKRRMQLEALDRFSKQSTRAQHSTAQGSTHLCQHQQAHQGPRPSAYDQPRQQCSRQQSRQDDLAQESQPVRLNLNVQKPVMVVQKPDASGKGSGCEEAVVSDGA
jgi:hypothetical protein